MLCGMTAPEQSYLHGLAFADQPNASGAATLPLKKIFAGRLAAASACSLIALSSSEFKLSTMRRSGRWFMIPFWVRGKLPLPLPREILLRNSVKDDLRRVRRHEFEYEVTRDPARFDNFYHQMYVPLARKAHGKAAHIQSHDEARQHQFEFDLLLIRQKNSERDIAGVTILYEPDRPRLLSLGICDDEVDYAQQGVSGALYHFAFQYLQTKGFSEVGTGGSRAFLRDGVLSYKKKMGQSLIGGSWNSIALKITALTPATQSFLKRNPFIHQSGGKLHAAIFTDEPLSLDRLRDYDKEFFQPGLEKLVVYSFRPDETLRPDVLPPDLALRWEIRPAHELLDTGPARA